jgi:hypothetical protein
VAAVSGATPPGGQLLSAPLVWYAPPTLPSGRYQVLVEASLEGDFDDAHRHPSFPDVNSELRSFGADVLGQPSVVYAVPITLDGSAQLASTARYAGYGSWDGSTGDLYPPDETIRDTPGSGAGRLLAVDDGWRVQVTAGGCSGCTAPPGPGPLTLTAADTSITVGFTAPDPAPARYEVRYRAGAPLDEASFDDGIPAAAPPASGPPGGPQTFALTGLKAETLYSVGVRALSPCGAPSAARFASATTTAQRFAVLHGCFLATAAWGSPLAPELAWLRRLRDGALSRSTLGRLAIAVYYVHSPPLAAAIASDERLRSLARAALAPAVALARAWVLADAAVR